jgi:RimJ/RimL family protein N-acetyltransferase
MPSYKNLNGKQIPPELIGYNIYLREMIVDDLLFTHDWFLRSDPPSMTCREYDDITPEEKLAKAKKKKTTGKVNNYILMTKTDARPVGKVSYFNVNMANRSAELGCLINPDERLKGYASEGLKLLISYLFNIKKLNKVHAQTGEFNSGSTALLESLGFRLDGTLREHHMYNDRLYSDLVFSLLKKECNF